MQVVATAAPVHVERLTDDEQTRHTAGHERFGIDLVELDAATRSMVKLFPTLLRLAECEKTCDMLAAEIEKTRRRVNALEHVMIPEMERNIKFITMKLEDNERQNITRLMKVKDVINAR